MEHTVRGYHTLLDFLGADDPIDALQRICFYKCESQGGHLFKLDGSLIKEFLSIIEILGVRLNEI